jgi:hypothetical protein
MSIILVVNNVLNHMFRLPVLLVNVWIYLLEEFNFSQHGGRKSFLFLLIIDCEEILKKYAF